ncbi:sarcosine oxidase subunit gamma family protein [Kribbella sp. NPDC050820]|uniref:sarcosine oxidase subunit gamma n=1 Tax=Kribbella sp. NPDC050820 TaxID=3155408 RepID=UPI0033D15E61
MAESGTLQELQFFSMVSLRVDPDSAAARGIECVLESALPGTCGEVSRRGDQVVLWLGPDEWLIVSEPAVADVAARLRVAAGGGHAAIVDVPANRTILELSGPQAREVLEKGCPVDLHPRVLADDTAVLTTLARVPVLLWKVDRTTFRVLPRTSFTSYVSMWLLDAMQEFAA